MPHFRSSSVRRSPEVVLQVREFVTSMDIAESATPDRIETRREAHLPTADFIFRLSSFVVSVAGGAVLIGPMLVRFTDAMGIAPFFASIAAAVLGCLFFYLSNRKSL